MLPLFSHDRRADFYLADFASVIGDEVRPKRAVELATNLQLPRFLPPYFRAQLYWKIFANNNQPQRMSPENR